MRDASAAGGNPVDRVFQEAVGGSALPLGIAGRKMRSDIAVRQRPEDRIDQRMEADIAVGMREKAAAVRYPHPADHQVIAVTEGVNVVAIAGSDIAEHGAEAGFFANEILRGGQLHVGRIAFKGRHRQSRPFRKRGVVGEIAPALAGGTAMRLENHVEPERLRRLRHAQPRPLRSRFDVSGVADQLDGVGDRDSWYRRAGARRRVDRPRDQSGRDEWSRRVVDQHDVGLLAGEGFQAGMHRGLAGCPASCRRRVGQCAYGIQKHGNVVRIQNRLHGMDLRMPAERFHGTENHRLSANRAVLFRSPRAGAEPAPGCDKDGCSPWCFRHWTR